MRELPESAKRWSITAVIGHADEPQLLRRCIEHHLNIGVERIFVSLNRGDPESAAVVESFAGTGRVRGEPVERFAPDPFEFFTAAIERVRAWSDSDWVFFVDTDEFWLPLSGDIRDTRGLDDFDLLLASRHNAPPFRTRDGSVTWPSAVNLASAVFGDPEKWLGPWPIGDGVAPWIAASDVGKILVRTRLLDRVGRGAHKAVLNIDNVRYGPTVDLMIVHLPITTQARFRRKIHAIRERMQTFGQRFADFQALHWKRWLELDDQGLIDDEFWRQVISADEIQILMQKGLLLTPARLFQQWALKPPVPHAP